MPAGDRVGLVWRWDELTREVVEPWYRETVAFDRHRLAEIEAQIAGVPYETDDQAVAARRGAAAQRRQRPRPPPRHA